MTTDSGSTEKDRPNPESWKQLQVWAIKPTYGAPGVVACCFFVSIILITPGIAVVLASDKIFEKEYRYDDVSSCTYLDHDSILNITMGSTTYSQGCRTRLKLSLTQKLDPPIYMYYKIVGFHQNYRDYVDSRSDLQLRGDPGLTFTYMANCEPLLHPGSLGGYQRKDPIDIAGWNTTIDQLVYSPCGAIAWSMFNDTINLYQTADPSMDLTAPVLNPAVLTTICRGGAFTSDGTPLSGAGPCTKAGISLPVDLKKRFGQPQYAPRDWTGRPENASNYYRANGYYYGEVGHRVPNATDEDFIVWSRLAAMPNFRKLYRKITTKLLPGDYVLDIEEFFDTTKFGGKKYVVLATDSWIGAKNYVLGALLLTLGSAALVNALAFFLIGTLKRAT